MPAPFEFTGVVRLTRLGAGHLLFTMLVGFAAINTGNNSLYVALSFMLGTLLLSGIASKSGLRNIEIQLGNVGEIWAARPAHVTLRVINRSRVWNVRDLVIVGAGLDRASIIPLLPRKSAVEIDLEFRFERRGRVRLTSADLYTRFPFGLFLKKRRVRLDGDFIVYPRIVEGIGLPPMLSPKPGETEQTSHPGPGQEIHSFRDYVRGDSLRHVHWKRSASLGRWIMKQTEHEKGRHLAIAVDPVIGSADPEDFETAVSEAATLLHEALAAGFDVTLLVPPAEIRSEPGKSSRPMFEALALIESRREGRPFAAPPGAIVFSCRRRDEARIA